LNKRARRIWPQPSACQGFFEKFLERSISLASTIDSFRVCTISVTKSYNRQNLLVVSASESVSLSGSNRLCRDSCRRMKIGFLEASIGDAVPTTAKVLRPSLRSSSTAMPIPIPIPIKAYDKVECIPKVLDTENLAC